MFRVSLFDVPSTDGLGIYSQLYLVQAGAIEEALKELIPGPSIPVAIICSDNGLPCAIELDDGSLLVVTVSKHQWLKRVKEGWDAGHYQSKR